MKQSIILNTDSYKASMAYQYPENTTGVFSYISSRGGKYKDLVFFGTQAFIKEYLSVPITQEDIDLAESIWSAHGLPFYREGWEYILNEKGGYLPLKIRAAPEGTIVPSGEVMLTIENTDPKCFWLTTYVETALLRAIWYPVTVATNSREIKKVIAKYLDKTGDIAGLDFKLHDFGARGASSNESAMIGGMAHLVNFMGTDTIAAVVGARHYYNEPIAGYSIPASEHSTITSWGRDGEVYAYRNMVKQFGGKYPLIAVVSDSYDIFNAADNIWGKDLRQEVVDSGSTVVVRPDSGDPVEIVVKVTEILDKNFGSTVNDKGYKVLNNVRVIQGDGIDIDTIDDILEALTSLGYSADNIAFGMGGALLQAPQRDDQKFAMKASSACVNGEWVDVFKDPITDKGKSSMKGRLALSMQCGIGSCSLRTIPEDLTLGNWSKFDNFLEPVYCDGQILNETSFCEIRDLAKIKSDGRGSYV